MKLFAVFITVLPAIVALPIAEPVSNAQISRGLPPILFPASYHRDRTRDDVAKGQTKRPAGLFPVRYHGDAVKSRQE